MQGNDGDGRGRTERRREDSTAEQQFDSDALFKVIAEAQSSDQAANAMRMFATKGDEDALRKAIALYTRSARTRGKSIENVLAELNELSSVEQRRYDHSGKLLEPSAMKKLVLRTVLDEFDGDGQG